MQKETEVSVEEQWCDGLKSPLKGSFSKAISNFK